MNVRAGPVSVAGTSSVGLNSWSPKLPDVTALLIRSAGSVPPVIAAS